jgi:glycerol kinase
MGDQQSALFGQACFQKGMAKCTYGTGAFMLGNIGSAPLPSKKGLLTTVAWKHKNETAYAFEGAAFIAGAAVQWLRDQLKMIESANEIEDLAREVQETGSVVFVPAFSGLGAPHWEPNAKAALLGVTRDTSKGHIARAVLEGIANQNRDILKAMEDDMGEALTELRVDGGASANHLLMQYQADILGVPIHQPQTLETTALGAAFAAGLGIGMWKDFHALETTWKKQRSFIPEMPEREAKFHLKKWKLGIKAVMALTSLKN